MREKIISFKAKPSSVDKENRIIRNAILAEVGEAKGHGFSVEKKFLTDLAAQCNNGLLSNFGHNYNNMGLQLGRAKQLRVEGNAAIADLHVYANADNSPKFQGMGTWVLNQALEDPESIMLSLRFIPSHFYQYDNNGKEITCRMDWWGDPVAEFKDRPIYVGLRKAKSVDVVDEGALTEKMFSADNDERGFFSKLFKFFKNSDMQDKKADPSVNAPGPDDIDDNVDDVFLGEKKEGGSNDGGYIWVGDKQFKAADVTALLTEITALKSGDGEMRSKIDLLTQKNGNLEAENKELKAQPAGELTNGETGNAPTPKTLSTADRFNAAINASLTTKK